jgi:hypothetical protein
MNEYRKHPILLSLCIKQQQQHHHHQEEKIKNNKNSMKQWRGYSSLMFTGQQQE